MGACPNDTPWTVPQSLSWSIVAPLMSHQCTCYCHGWYHGYVLIENVINEARKTITGHGWLEDIGAPAALEILSVGGLADNWTDGSVPLSLDCREHACTYVGECMCMGVRGW